MKKIVGKNNSSRLFNLGDMMNARIKLSAKAALTGSHIKIIPTLTALFLLVAIFSICNSAINIIPYPFPKHFYVVFPAVTLILSVAVISPLRLRIQIKHLLLARKTNPSYGIDMGLPDYIKACEMSVRMFFIRLFRFAVFEIIPAAASAVFLMFNAQKPVSLRASFVFFSGMLILALAGFGFYLLYIQKYSKAWFYLACYKDFSVSDAIAESIKRTDGKYADILFFKIGFVPWFLLCILIFPAFYVIPYYKQSITCLYLSR